MNRKPRKQGVGARGQVLWLRLLSSGVPWRYVLFAQQTPA